MSNVDSTKDAFFQLLIKKGPTEELLLPEKSDTLCSQIPYEKNKSISRKMWMQESNKA